jgi:hypothetical protein
MTSHSTQSTAGMFFSKDISIADISSLDDIHVPKV